MERNHAWNNRYRPDISHSPVLTDDRNPVDVLGERVNREARRAWAEVRVEDEGVPGVGVGDEPGVLGERADDHLPDGEQG